MPSTDVTIVGAGSWGRALAHTLLINKKIVKGKRAKPDSFIISSNGDWHWYWWCAHNECWANDKPTLEQCERESGVTCGRFAKRRTIFWDNGINTKGKRARFKSKKNDKINRSSLWTKKFYR